MRTQPHRVDLIVEFVGNPVVDKVFGEYTCTGQEAIAVLLIKGAELK